MVSITLNDEDAMVLYKLLSLISDKELNELVDGMDEDFLNIEDAGRLISTLELLLKIQNIKL